VLLFAKGVRTLVELGLADTPPDRVGFVAGLAILSIVAALTLLAGGRWGWLLAVGVLGWELAAELGLWWLGAPDYVALALLALCAILLTTPEMRAAHTSQSRA
jgi:hypothetical protein